MQSENPLDRIIGKSNVVKELKEKISKIAGFSYKSVLITGETGTGKELVADALHDLGPRSCKPMVKVNCSAIPHTLLESKLFGHRKGAFTGAESNCTGLVEEADGGILFLDEIGEMDITLQPKLLRFLECGTFRRIGETRERKVDLQIISATNNGLNDSTTFRSDVFYRLNGLEILVPPLRMRDDDCLVLFRHFFHYAKKSICKNSTCECLSENVIPVLKRYNWPGNVRELINMVHKIACFSSEKVVLPKHIHRFLLLKNNFSRRKDSNYKTLEEIECQHIVDTLSRTGNNIQKSALILGVTRNTLKNKIRKYNIYNEVVNF